jgi:phage terminase large subunit-like protein
MAAVSTLPYPPGYRGFLRFCADIGYAKQLKPFQREIARAHFSAARETVAVLPRGSAKSTLAALIAVHHCLSRERPSVFVGASTRAQARVIGQMVRRLAEHPAVRGHFKIRHDELRIGADTALLVIPADGGAAHGWERPTLMIGDEMWNWSDRDPTLLGAMLSSLLKNPKAKFLGISTAATTLDGPLGRLRVRALAQPHVERQGGVLRAHGDGLNWIEHSVPEEADTEDLEVVAQSNPLRTVAELREARPRLTELEWLQLVCGRWGVASARWLPAGSWSACRAVYEVDPAEPLVLGVDIGGSRSATAVVGCVGDEEGVRVACVEVWQGADAVLKAVDYIEQLIANGRPIREVVADPMRFSSELLRLERNFGISTTEWYQTETRMTRCSEFLHGLIVEKRLQHPGDRELDQHVANAVAKPTPRGWRLVKSHDGAQIDALIALAMAAERASVRAQPVKVLGWVL